MREKTPDPTGSKDICGNIGLILGLILTVAPLIGCSVVTQAVVITPGAGVQTVSVGQTVQFVATSTTQMGSATPTTGNITDSAVWASSVPGVATISASGLASAVAAGTTQITAESGGVVGLSSLTVTASVATNASTPSITVIPGPGAATASFVGETTQFLAIGSLDGSGVPRDLTNDVKWVSSDVAVATIAQSGLATAVSANATEATTTITAIGTTLSGSVITGSSNLQAGTGGSVTLPTLTLYKVGLGNGSVTSSPTGLSCGDQASCTGYFTLGSAVTLTALPDTGSTFAGWSSNCKPVTENSASCTLTMVDNETVGAVFNAP